ncbi:MAG: glycosyltransferase family 4 protein [Bacteroidia bacterium]|nr:glycosyltransferase family 4 protein [Bacteroidia bacterium]
MEFNRLVNGKPPIIYFGRLTDSKGVETLLNAIDILLQREPSLDWPLWIVGGNYQEIDNVRKNDACADAVKRLEAQRVLFWWGHIPHDVLPYLLAKSMLFCFTSRYEPGGRTILEAMASGLVVLATPYGFAEDVIEDGTNGYIIRSDNPEVWACQIQTLLSNPELCGRIGSNAKNTARNEFAMARFFEKHWAIYQAFLP